MHPNETLIRAGYDAFVNGDIQAVTSFLDPNVVWHVAGTGPLAGVYTGHGELLQFLARVAALTDGSISIEALDILVNEEHVIVLTRMRASRGSKSLDDRGVAVFKIADGKAFEVHMFPENQAALDEFFS